MSGREIFKVVKPLLIFASLCMRILPRSCRKTFWRMLDLFPGFVGQGLRWAILKSMAQECGDNVNVGTNVFIEGWQNLRIGTNVSLNKGAYLEATGGLIIGDNVSIAQDCSFISFEHTWDDPLIPIKYNPTKLAPIVLGNDIWLGCAVRVLSGVTLAERTVVAAGAVVTKSFPGHHVIGGVPAKIIKAIP